MSKPTARRTGRHAAPYTAPKRRIRKAARRAVAGVPAGAVIVAGFAGYALYLAHPALTGGAL